MHAVERYIRIAKKEGYPLSVIKNELEENFIGFEIDNAVRKKCLNRLDIKAKEYGVFGVNWNILNKDYLKYELHEKVDFIIGNPPYIMYQNIKKDRNYLRENFYTCSEGKFDYCYPFIEKSIKDLKDKSGKMSYLIPTSIFKNVFGEKLRSHMLPYLKKICDFKETQVFSNALVAPSIICLSKGRKSNYIMYEDMDNDNTNKILKKNLDNKKWVFSNINYFEEGQILGDYCKISNSVATLLNEAFVIKNFIASDSKYIKTKSGFIEKSILREAASPRGKAYSRDELIIFPYYYSEGILMHYTEDEFELLFPETHKYLLTKKEKLEKRDSDRSAKWFEYGRSQALSSINNKKMIVSSVITKEVKLYNLAEEAVPYSGFYIVPRNGVTIDFIKNIMQSDQFYLYIQKLGINANGSSLRFSVKDFMKFPLALLN